MRMYLLEADFDCYNEKSKFVKRFYKTEGAAINYAKKLVAEGFREVKIFTELCDLKHSWADGEKEDLDNTPEKQKVLSLKN